MVLPLLSATDPVRIPISMRAATERSCLAISVVGSCMKSSFAVSISRRKPVNIDISKSLGAFQCGHSDWSGVWCQQLYLLIMKINNLTKKGPVSRALSLGREKSYYRTTLISKPSASMAVRFCSVRISVSAICVNNLA